MESPITAPFEIIHAKAIGSICFSAADMMPLKETISVLTLGQGKLRCKLHIDHHADAAVELKEGRCFLSGEDLSEDRQIPLTPVCLVDVRCQPATNNILGLVIR